jgi:HAD superfamily hydrolase (TIGR01509 family)
MIKALFFDSGNVLAIEGFTPGVAEYEKINSILAGKLYASAHDRQYWKDFTLGKISEQEYFKCVADDFKEALDVEKLRAVIYQNFHINRELLEYIKTLKNKYVLGIISNNPKEMFDYLSATGGWNEIFDVKAISGYAHLRKPDAKIYEYALKQAKVTGLESVYIDDRPDRVQGAKQNNMKIIIYKNLEQLKKDLSAL